MMKTKDSPSDISDLNNFGFLVYVLWVFCFQRLSNNLLTMSGHDV